jgi:hypothetical protein
MKESHIRVGAPPRITSFPFYFMGATKNPLVRRYPGGGAGNSAFNEGEMVNYPQRLPPQPPPPLPSPSPLPPPMQTHRHTFSITDQVKIAVSEFFHNWKELLNQSPMLKLLTLFMLVILVWTIVQLIFLSKDRRQLPLRLVLNIALVVVPYFLFMAVVVIFLW